MVSLDLIRYKTDIALRGTKDQPREQGGHFGSGPGHTAQQKDHLTKAADADTAGDKDKALAHFKAAAAHGKAAEDPSTINSATAKQASEDASKT